MKDVVIDNRKELVMVEGKVVPRILLHMMRGAVGKSFVVERYKGGRMVVAHFPHMGGIVATGKQKVRRDLFREAVVWAKWIIADEGRKMAFRNALPRKKRRRVYQAALQMYMKMRGSKQWLREVLAGMEKQAAVQCVDISKQLAVEAVMSGRCETSIICGGLEQMRKMGRWRVMWQKKKDIVGVKELEAVYEC